MRVPGTGVVLIAIILASMIEPLRCKQWKAWQVEKRTGRIRLSKSNVYCGQDFDRNSSAREEVGSNMRQLKQEWFRLSKHDGVTVTNGKQMVQLFGISYVGIAGMFGVLSAVCVGYHIADEDGLTTSNAFVYWSEIDHNPSSHSASFGECRERSYKFLYTLEAF